MPFEKGNKVRLGDTNKGTGRKPDWYKQWCREAITKQSRLNRIEQVLDKGPVKEFWEVWKYLFEVSHGKPTQSLEVTTHNGDEGRPSTEALIGTIRELREQIGYLRERTKVETGK